jgi:hypothetical protein
MTFDTDKQKTMSNEQELFGRLNEVLKERFNLRSDGSHVFKCGHFKILVLEARGTSATNHEVMLWWTPLPRFDKKTAIRSKGLKVQHRERTKPCIWWHGVLGVLASLEVWTNDNRVDMAIMELKYLKPHNSFVRLIKVIDQTL